MVWKIQFEILGHLSQGVTEAVIANRNEPDMLLRESGLNKDLLKKASVLHYGSMSLIEEPCRSTQLAAMKIQKNKLFPSLFFHDRGYLQDKIEWRWGDFDQKIQVSIN
ncbi:hypothetical protein C5167_014455 [Papaver somniferum]|uniref:Uncharacterized protein n=1 Tax=Papaver somniferum TaxID=3469 RepID=A0A4Y7J792_PAPSO|nr:hypothetical protein C5167_014455 [Papaver somniferum]